MKKSLGIAALVVCIVAIIVPVAGPYLTVIVALLAVFAYGEGLPMAAAALVLNVVNILFLSPSLYITEGLTAMAQEQTGEEVSSVMAFLLTVQVAAAVLLFVLQRSRGRRQPEPVAAAA